MAMLLPERVRLASKLTRSSKHQALAGFWGARDTSGFMCGPLSQPRWTKGYRTFSGSGGVLVPLLPDKTACRQARLR